MNQWINDQIKTTSSVIAIVIYLFLTLVQRGSILLNIIDLESLFFIIFLVVIMYILIKSP